MSRLQIQDERIVDAARKVITSLLEDKLFCDHLDNLDMSSVSIKFFEEFLRMTRDHLISNGIRIKHAMPVLLNLIINDLGEQTYINIRKQPCELNGIIFENELVINNPFEKEFHGTVFENTVTINCDVYQGMFSEAEFKSDVILTPSCDKIESNAFYNSSIRRLVIPKTDITFELASWRELAVSASEIVYEGSKEELTNMLLKSPDIRYLKYDISLSLPKFKFLNK